MTPFLYGYALFLNNGHPPPNPFSLHFSAQTAFLFFLPFLAPLSLCGLGKRADPAV